MRPGVESFTDAADDEAFMQMGPIFLTGIAERLSPGNRAGKLEYVVACFEKTSVMITQLGDEHLAVSVEGDDALAVFKRILNEIPKLTR